MTVARWTLLDYGRHGKALENTQQPAKGPSFTAQADAFATVFNDEEKRTRVTTQVHKVARVG